MGDSFYLGEFICITYSSSWNSSSDVTGDVCSTNVLRRMDGSSYAYEVYKKTFWGTLEAMVWNIWGNTGRW